MPDSPFAPDAPDFLPDQGQLQQMGPAPSMGPSPDEIALRQHREKQEALMRLIALAAPMALGPASRIANPLLRYAGITGLTTAGLAGLLGSGDAEAKTKGKPAAPAAAPGTSTQEPQINPDAVLPEDLESYKGLLQSRKKWQELLDRGTPRPETQGEIDKLDAKIRELTGKVTKRANDAASAKKAQEHEDEIWKYRKIGGGIGLGLGTLASLVAGGRFRGAAQRFTGATDAIPGLVADEGNVLTSLGQRAPQLRAAVNTAAEAGGARPPMGDLTDIYAATNATRLNQAKGQFAATNRAADVPPPSMLRMAAPKTTAPFSKSTSERITTVPFADKLPYVGYGDFAFGQGMKAMQTDDDSKNMWDAISQAGLAGGLGYKGARYLANAGITSGFQPGQTAMRNFQTGRQRLSTDVANVSLADLKAYARGQSGQFTNNTLQQQAAQQLAARAAAGRADFLQNVVPTHPGIQQAVQRSMDPANPGRVDLKRFARELRTGVGGLTSLYTHQHNGRDVDLRITPTMVRDIARQLGVL
jgi:hypothetical protein